MSTSNDEKLLDEESDDEEIQVMSESFSDKIQVVKSSFVKQSTFTDSEIILDDSDSESDNQTTLSPVPTIVRGRTTIKYTDISNNQSKAARKVSSSIKILNSNSSAKLVTENTSKSNIKKGIPSKKSRVPAKVILKKVGSQWQNSSLTEPGTKSKSIVDEEPESDSDNDFIPFKEDVSLDSSLNGSFRSTRSRSRSLRGSFSNSDVSLNTTFDSDATIEDEATDNMLEELSHLERLSAILSQSGTLNGNKSKTLPTHKKPKKSLKKSKSVPDDVKKLKKPEVKSKSPMLPKIIERGPIDCFDDLIIETNQGFPCNLCDKGEIFKKRREMIFHLQTRHEDELNDDQKNSDLSGIFPCDICHTAFYSKYILRTHQKAHKKSTSSTCDKYYQYYLRFGRI